MKIKVRLSIAILVLSVMMLFLSADVFAMEKYYKCEAHGDCVVKGCCPALCINKEYVQKPCPDRNMECEISYFPEGEICGCVNGTCQSSKEIFETYERLLQQALDLTESGQPLENSLELCNQMHREHVFNCYVSVSEKIHPTNFMKAVSVCESLADKYYRDFDETVRFDKECFSSLASKIAREDADLAVGLCEKALKKPMAPESINYSESCFRDIVRIVAINDDVKALDMCDRKSSEREFCMQLVAVSAKNPSICQKLLKEAQGEMDITPDMCYDMLARELHDKKICEKIQDSITKEYCIGQ